MNPQNPQNDHGPLSGFPATSNHEDVQAAQRLAGHVTSSGWLPPDEWEPLSEARAEQLRHRAQLADAMTALRELTASHEREDRDHAEALRRAFRDGTADEVEDKRTPLAQRAADRHDLEVRVWAAVRAFGEVVGEIIELVREHEDEWLADLRGRREAAEAKRREAARLLDEARAVEHRIMLMGRWVQCTADDSAMGQQPAPTVEPVPANLAPTALADALERHWTRLRPWNAASDTRATV